MGILDGLTGGMKLYNLPIVGSFFDNPNEEAKQNAFMQASQLYNAYRPEAAQTRVNALRMQLSARDGARNWMARMAPGVYQDPIVDNPMSPRQATMGGVTGTTNGDMDVGGTLGQGARGAAAGALVGSVVPGVGTAGGAMIGGGLGLLSAMGQGPKTSWSLNDPGIMQAYDPTANAKRRTR